MDSDIALLQLTEPLKLNHYVRPVCLPEEEEEVQPSQVCTITGWGAYDEGTQLSLLHGAMQCEHFILASALGHVGKLIISLLGSYGYVDCRRDAWE